MKRIGDDFPKALRGLGPAGAMPDIVRAWPAAVGEAIARNAWPARLARDGTLHVTAASAAWSFELTSLEATIRERLRAALGNQAPGRLRFAPGPLPEVGLDDPSSAVPTPPEPRPQDRARADEVAAGIEDDELRGLVARAAAASLYRGRSDRAL